MNTKEPPSGANTYGILQVTSQQDKVDFREKGIKPVAASVHESKGSEQATEAVVSLQNDGKEERLRQLKACLEYVQLLDQILEILSWRLIKIIVAMALPILLIVALVYRDSAMLLAFMTLLTDVIVALVSQGSDNKATKH